jgi:hypothetical protein
VKSREVLAGVSRVARDTRRLRDEIQSMQEETGERRAESGMM